MRGVTNGHRGDAATLASRNLLSHIIVGVAVQHSQHWMRAIQARIFRNYQLPRETGLKMIHFLVRHHIVVTIGIADNVAFAFHEVLLVLGAQHAEKMLSL